MAPALSAPLVDPTIRDRDPTGKSLRGFPRGRDGRGGVSLAGGHGAFGQAVGVLPTEGRSNRQPLPPNPRLDAHRRGPGPPALPVRDPREPSVSRGSRSKNRPRRAGPRQ